MFLIGLKENIMSATHAAPTSCRKCFDATCSVAQHVATTQYAGIRLLGELKAQGKSTAMCQSKEGVFRVCHPEAAERSERPVSFFARLFNTAS